MNRFAVLTFAFIFFTPFLFSCGNKEHSAKKVIEINGTKITISAISAKAVDASITGTPHAPIIIPYFKTEKSLVITLEADKGAFVVAESHSNMDSLLSGKDLKKLIGTISVFLSTDKKHIAYARSLNKSDTTILFHLLEEKFPFGIPLKRNALPGWQKMGSPEEIAAAMMGDTALTYEISNSLWTALAKTTPENKLDFRAIELWDKNYSARKFIADRCWKWSASSEKWKKEIRNMFAVHFSLYTSAYLKSHDVSATLKELCELSYTTHDKDLILDCHKALAEGLAYSFSLVELFKNEYSWYTKDTTTLSISEQMKNNLSLVTTHQLKNSQNTLVADRFLNVAFAVYDTTLIDKCMTVMVNNWPADSISRVTLPYRNNYIPFAEIKKLKERAIKELSGKYPESAKGLLEDICTCEELKRLQKKHSVDFRLPLDCK